MPRFLVFASQAEAQAAVDAIDESGRAIYAARGYAISEGGSIVCRRLSDGASVPESQGIDTWDVPRQRLDGKWIISHPENHNSGSILINGVPASDVVMTGVTPDSIEEFSLAWFE